MAGQTLSIYDTMLKEDYQPVVVHAFSKKIPLYDLIRKNNKNWRGREVVEAITVARNPGVGSRPDGGGMPTAGNVTNLNHIVTCKYNYGRIQLTGPVIRASETNAGAFSSALDTEVEGMVQTLPWNIDRQLYGDGSGTLAVVLSGSSGTTITLKYAGAATSPVSGQPGTRFIKKGMVLNIGTAAEHAAGTCETCTVSSVTNRYVFEATGSVTVVADDIVVLGGAVTLINSSYGHDIEGLATFMVTTGTVQNINVSLYSDYTGNVYSASGVNRTLTWDLIQTMIDDVSEKGGEIDLIVAHTSMRKEYIDMLNGDKRYVGARLEAGYKGPLSFFQGDREISVMFVNNCQYNWIYGLDVSTWTMFEMGGPEWNMLGGSILKYISGSDAAEGLFNYYANLGCKIPGWNGVIKDIFVSLRAS